MPRRTPRSSERCSSGEAGPQRDVVLLNAGAALFVAGQADTVKAGIAKAAAAIDSGAAMEVLEEADCGLESTEQARERDAGPARGDRRRHARPR